MSLHGASELHRRLEAMVGAVDTVAGRWADSTAEGMRARIPRRTGATADSVRVGQSSPHGASVLGSPVVNMLASGTREHEIVPRNARVLRFKSQGRTVFSRRVLHPPTQGDPTIRAAAREALDDSFKGPVLGAWNGAA